MVNAATPKPRDPSPFWLQRRANRGKTHFARRPSRREQARERLLKDWYGSDRGRIEIMARQSHGRPIAGVVGEILANMPRNEPALLERLRQHWPELVGRDVAAQTRPAALDHGWLQIEVANSTWRFILEREHKSSVDKRLRAFAEGRLTGIRFVPAGRYMATPEREQPGPDPCP